MKRFFAPFLLGLMLGATPVHARIGETLEQCIERYGPVTDRRDASVKESDPKACVFTNKGVTALVEFKDGVVWRMVFKLPGMTPAEVETLLKANLPEGGWGPSQKIGVQEFRLSADKRRMAIYTPTKAEGEISSLTIATREYGVANYAAYSAKVNEALRNVKARKPGKDLNGF